MSPGRTVIFDTIDDCSAIRECHVRADGFDFRTANENDLVREYTARLHIDELAGADGGDECGRRGCGGRNRQPPARTGL